MIFRDLLKRKSVAPSLENLTKQLIKLPPVVIWVTIAISVLPFLISLIVGYGFGNHSLKWSAEQLSKMQGKEITESMLLAMSGALTHAFHTLVAGCLISANADNSNLITLFPNTLFSNISHNNNLSI